jgi:hypothetical protein
MSPYNFIFIDNIVITGATETLVKKQTQLFSASGA